MQTILIVDNSRAVRKVLQEKVVSELQLKTQVAATFAEAKQALERNPLGFGVAVVGLTLTDAPNGEIVDYVLTRDIPVIVLTASWNERIREYDGSRKIVDYIVKNDPRCFDQVLALIQRLLRNTQIRILVVADSEALGAHMVYLLESSHYITFEATTEETALDLLEKHPEITLMITTCHALKPQSVEFIAYVRKKYRREQLAIIILDTSEGHSLSASLLKAGADELLSMPFAEEEFYVRVTRTIDFLEMEKTLRHQNVTIATFQAQCAIELEQAQHLMQLCCSQTIPDFPGVRLAMKHISGDRLGGDICEIIDIDQKRFGLLIGDVSGRGVSATLLSLLLSHTMKTVARQYVSPASVLTTVNQKLFQKIPADAFATAFYCLYDSETHSLTFTAAGHPAGYLLQARQQELLALQYRSLMLGAFSNETARYAEERVRLAREDKVFLYTKGLPNACNSAGEPFGTERLEQWLLDHSHLPITELLDSTYAHLLEFTGTDVLKDDPTMLGMEIVF